MKKFLALILALAMALSLVACGSAPADDGDAAATDEPIKIGFVNYDPTAEQYLVLSDYFDYLAETFNIEIIADGMHLPPELLRLIVKTKELADKYKKLGVRTNADPEEIVFHVVMPDADAAASDESAAEPEAINEKKAEARAAAKEAKKDDETLERYKRQYEKQKAKEAAKAARKAASRK